MRIEQMNGEVHQVDDTKPRLDETGRQIRLLTDRLTVQLVAGQTPTAPADFITGLADSITDIQSSIQLLFGNNELVDRSVYTAVLDALASASDVLDNLAEVIR